MAQVQSFLGHASIKSTEIYAKTNRNRTEINTMNALASITKTIGN